MVDENTDVNEYLNTLAEEIAAQRGTFPEPPDKDNLLKFVRDIVNQPDAVKLSRTANFTKEEVGDPRIPSLTYLHIADYADIEGHQLVAEFMRSKVGSLATLSLGRKAKLLDSTFTVRRETKNFGTPKTTTKKTLWGETTEKQGGEES